jgi:uncharacterized protein (TIGR02145 family)
MCQKLKGKLIPFCHGTSFMIISVILITILIAFNSCEKPKRAVQVTALEALPADVSFTSATLKGEINDLGSGPIEDHGILVSANSNPRIGNSNAVSLGKCSSRGGFQVKAENLAINTTYYFRAFASINGEDIYSEPVRQFKTKDCTPPTVTTSAVSSVTSSTASINGNIGSDGGAPVIARGLCWSISPNPTVAADTTIDGTGIGSFSGTINGLTNNTLYHVRAYATNVAGTTYGEDLSFTTSAIPTVITAEASSVISTSAVSGGNVLYQGDSPVTARGICWNTQFNPTTADGFTTNGQGTGQFTSEIINLTPGITYHIRAYATNLAGTAYGEDKSFTTPCLPSISTIDISSITSTSAISGGNVTSDGHAPVTTRGVCWSASSNPTIDNQHISNGEGTGTFSCAITGLIPGTTYYVRAYATNSVGTAYGENKSFTTYRLPALTTTLDFNSITSTTVISGGNITSDGGTIVTVRGICWSTSVNPTTDNTHSTNGSGPGSFNVNITGLIPGTKYYVCAYATNSVGTAYGDIKSFTTFSLPSITTTIDFPSITSTSVTSGGNITSDGGTPVTKRGLCWSTSENPTTDNTHSDNGIGPDSFIYNVTGLTTGTLYHIRAYAINSVGTAYGADVQFTTLCIPDIYTSGVSLLTPSSATSGGNISSGCGAVVTARGVCWSKASAPTIVDNHTSEGSGTGSFSSKIDGLSFGTVYYVRAYATTNLGTIYGNELSFITFVADISGNVYKTTAIGTQIWMAENLKTTKLNDGTNIPLVADSTAWSNLLTLGYCWYNNDEAGNIIYGPLYNWSTVNTGKLCPSGWHVPDNNELTILTDYLGGISVGGGKLKETGTIHWVTPNTAATDDFNFKGLPGGSRGATGAYGNIGKYSYWWVNTAHPFDPDYAWGYVLSYISAEIIRANYYYKKDGFSVRCVHN